MIITLCGSTRFEAWFHIWNEMLSLAGHQVFSLASFPSLHRGKKEWYTEEEKAILDYGHKVKIELSDAIMVLNVFAYIGESTMKEIEHAQQHNKSIFALESWGHGCGVGAAHQERYVCAKKKYVPADYVSPIDTFYPHMTDPWASSLLGPAGRIRSALVERFRAFESKVIDRE